MSSTGAIGLFLVVVLGATAIVDFAWHPRALALTGSLRIPPRMVPVLGAVKAAAAVGLVLSTDRPRLGELTGACLVVFFAIATLTHLRSGQKDARALPAFLLMCVSALYVVAQVAR